MKPCVTRNRGDAELVYSPTDRLSLSGFGGTVQDNYNHRGGVNSAAALNFVPGTAPDYFSYGVLKDLSYNAGFDADVTITNSVSMYAEYSWERYDKSMVSRYRVPGSGAAPTPLNCSVQALKAAIARITTGAAGRAILSTSRLRALTSIRGKRHTSILTIHCPRRKATSAAGRLAIRPSLPAPINSC